MTLNQLQNRYTSHPIKLNICPIQSPSSNILVLSDIYCILLDICCILLRYLYHDPFRYLPNPFRYLPHPIRYLNIDLSNQITVSFCQIYNSNAKSYQIFTPSNQITSSYKSVLSELWDFEIVCGVLIFCKWFEYQHICNTFYLLFTIFFKNYGICFKKSILKQKWNPDA